MGYGLLVMGFWGAAAAGLSIISGYELFFYQGVHAWGHFSGKPLDEARLRQDLLAEEEAA